MQMQPDFFTEFWKGQPLRLIGVALTGLTDGSFEQMSLFENTETKNAAESWMQPWMRYV